MLSLILVKRGRHKFVDPRMRCSPYSTEERASKIIESRVTHTLRVSVALNHIIGAYCPLLFGTLSVAMYQMKIFEMFQPRELMRRDRLCTNQVSGIGSVHMPSTLAGGVNLACFVYIHSRVIAFHSITAVYPSSRFPTFRFAIPHSSYSLLPSFPSCFPSHLHFQPWSSSALRLFLLLSLLKLRQR